MADKYSISARVLVNGKKVREYAHDDKLFIESKDGTEFEIDVKNHNSNRVMVIVSVDGIDVINGKPATNDSSGYIIGGNDAIRIKGFRKDTETVGSFKFTSNKNSYANGKGDGGNEGIISVRFFEEKRIAREPMWRNHDSYMSHQPNLADIPNTNKRILFGNSSDTLGLSQVRGLMNTVVPTNNVDNSCCTESSKYYSVENKEASFDMGTTWGSKKRDSAVEIDFEKGNLFSEINLYYASRQGLINMGVPLTKETYISLPKGFKDFATPPAGWEG